MRSKDHAIIQKIIEYVEGYQRENKGIIPRVYKGHKAKPRSTLTMSKNKKVKKHNNSFLKEGEPTFDPYKFHLYFSRPWNG